MEEIYNTDSQDNVVEEIILNLKTQKCQFIQSELYKGKNGIEWQKFIDYLIEQKFIYYIDVERFLQEVDIKHICKKLAQLEAYSFQFRINDGKHHEWFTIKISVNEKDNDNTKIISARVILKNQNLYNIQDKTFQAKLMDEVLLKGFGSVFSYIMWIDIKNDRYKMINTCGNRLDIEMSVLPVGSHSVDNKGYAINNVYEEDWDTYYKYTSSKWLQENLKQEGDRFSFIIRHIYNGEYRWTEVNLVCIKRNADDFHVLYWIEDVNDKVYDNTAMKDTLTSVEVGQWRYEIRDGEERKLTVSPSLMRILGIKDSEDHETILNDIKNHIYLEDLEKLKESMHKLTYGEETSVTLRSNNRSKGLRYYRCGITCVAENDIYTCYQGYGQDVTDIMQPMVTSIKHAEELSFTDKLTGLHNRNYMESRCESFMRKGDLPVSLIMADCNYLKQTNDTLGHEYGDLLLQRVTRSIQECLMENSIAMRIGGDEFLIICAHCPAESVSRMVDAIRQKLRKYSDEILQLSVSFGTCTVENYDVSFKDAYNIADRAMYEEKQHHHKRNLKL